MPLPWPPGLDAKPENEAAAFTAPNLEKPAVVAAVGNDVEGKP
jgi:hypothetical protein